MDLWTGEDGNFQAVGQGGKRPAMDSTDAKLGKLGSNDEVVQTLLLRRTSGKVERHKRHGKNSFL